MTPTLSADITPKAVGLRSRSPELQASQRSTTVTSTVLPLKAARMRRPHSGLLLGLPFGVEGSKSTSARARNVSQWFKLFARNVVFGKALGAEVLGTSGCQKEKEKNI
jgi:hypothetical protein